MPGDESEQPKVGTGLGTEFLENTTNTHVRSSPASWLGKRPPTQSSPSSRTTHEEGLFGDYPGPPGIVTPIDVTPIVVTPIVVTPIVVTPQVIAEALSSTTEIGLFEVHSGGVFEVPASAQLAAHEAFLAAKRHLQQSPIMPTSVARAHEAAAAQVAQVVHHPVAAQVVDAQPVHQPVAITPSPVELHFPIPEARHEPAAQSPSPPETSPSETSPSETSLPQWPQWPSVQPPQQFSIHSAASDSEVTTEEVTTEARTAEARTAEARTAEARTAKEATATQVTNDGSATQVIVTATQELLRRASVLEPKPLPVVAQDVQVAPVLPIPLPNQTPVPTDLSIPSPNQAAVPDVAVDPPRLLSAAERAVRPNGRPNGRPNAQPNAMNGTEALGKEVGWLRRRRIGRRENVPGPSVEVDSSTLPPTSRPGLIIARPVAFEDIPKQKQSRRDRKRHQPEIQQAEIQQPQEAPNAATGAYVQPTYVQFAPARPSPVQILDTRLPGKSHADSSFIVPLVPAIILAAGSAYLWFQASARIGNPLIPIPLFMGLIIGGTMRRGSKSADFARTIFAVVVTAIATLVGHAWVVGHPKNSAIAWSDIPPVFNTDPLSTFMLAADRSLGGAALMFAGLITAAVSASQKER